MKIKLSDYHGSPCLTVTGSRFYFDADINTRRPYGVCAGFRVGEHSVIPDGTGFSLDLNAPLGEPNRLYVSGPRRHYTIGLVSWHTQVKTGERTEGTGLRRRVIYEMKHVRCRPRLIRSQAWDGDLAEYTRCWHWIVAVPRNWRDLWAAAHPEEHAQADLRRSLHELAKVFGMHAGMSRAERVAKRTEIRDEMVRQAEHMAARTSISLACRMAVDMAAGGNATADQVRIQHATCMAEVSGGGCLDACHDPED